MKTIAAALNSIDTDQDYEEIISQLESLGFEVIHDDPYEEELIDHDFDYETGTWARFRRFIYLKHKKYPVEVELTVYRTAGTHPEEGDWEEYSTSLTWWEVVE